MNQILPLLLALLPLAAGAQPKNLKQARKSLLTLHAIQPGGDTLRSAAFFLDESGTLAAPYQPIRRARQAWAEDERGTRYPVTHVAGFSSTYNAVRLLAEAGKKKTPFLTPAPAPLSAGEALYRPASGQAEEIKNVERAGSHAYYTLASPADPAQEGSPLLNAGGQAAAVLQTPLATPGATNYALDIAFVQGLSIGAMDANHPDLQACAIPKQLPAEEQQALSFLYIHRGEPELHRGYLRTFIAAHPHNAAGYTLLGEALVNQGTQAEAEGQQEEALQAYTEARQTYEAGLKAAQTTPDEVLYGRSLMVYTLASQRPNLPEGFSLEQALSDIRQAQQLKPMPLYTLHEARLLFLQKQYAEAEGKFLSLTQTNMRSADLFLYAALCREQLGAKPEEQLALQDSAVACFTKPYPAEAANALWLRAQTLKTLARYREAIADLNDYERLLMGRLTDVFYYERALLASRARMLQQALVDIQKAIGMTPREPIYHAEQASLLVRVNELDAAIAACQKALALNDGQPDAHRILGVCLREKGNQAEARKHLKRAAELGDPMAQDILQKMQ